MAKFKSVDQKLEIPVICNGVFPVRSRKLQDLTSHNFKGSLVLVSGSWESVDSLKFKQGSKHP